MPKMKKLRLREVELPTASRRSWRPGRPPRARGSSSCPCRTPRRDRQVGERAAGREAEGGWTGQRATWLLCTHEPSPHGQQRPGCHFICWPCATPLIYVYSVTACGVLGDLFTEIWPVNLKLICLNSDSIVVTLRPESRSVQPVLLRLSRVAF